MTTTPPPAPMLSVIMSVYNGAPYLPAAIASVLGQTMDSFEFLILDDGSSDASPAILREAAARDPRIRLTLRENRGLVASLNELLGQARAPLVARMDADDVCHRERFARQTAFLEAHRDHGVVGSAIRTIDGEGALIAGAPHRYPASHDEFLAAIAAQQPLLCHPAVMMRRACVEAVGGYRAAFRHCEDYDLWLRLAGVTRMANLPETLLDYRRHGEQVTNRHLAPMLLGAAVARLAHGERLAGRPDPTAAMTTLAPLEELDRLFGREGVAAQVRREVVPGLLHSPDALAGEAFALILREAHEARGSRADLWRTVLRLVRLGMPGRALRLGLTLLARGFA